MSAERQLLDEPDVPPWEELRFRIVLDTRWVDEDNQSVLNNAVYMTLLEEARRAWCERLGVMRSNHFPFLLMQTNIRFLAPGRGGRRLEVALATTGIGGKSFTQAYRIRDLEGGHTLCEAEALLVGFDAERGVSTELKAGFQSAVEELEGSGSRETSLEP